MDALREPTEAMNEDADKVVQAVAFAVGLETEDLPPTVRAIVITALMNADAAARQASASTVRPPAHESDRPSRTLPRFSIPPLPPLPSLPGEDDPTIELSDDDS